MTEHPSTASAADRSVQPDPDYLYPPVEPDEGGYLETGEGHRVWWEASGDRRGVPVILLHGGPGGAPRPTSRRFYNPAVFRLYVMHQRGCGRSLPLAETANNDTPALIRDIEALRARAGVERWLVTGGSWGTLLALSYGGAWPERCLGFALIGVMLGRPEDRDWWWDGTRMLYPEAWDRVLEALPADARAVPRDGIHRLLSDPDPDVHLPAARAICLYSAATAAVTPDRAVLAAYDDPDVTLPLARLFIHYNRHDYFLAPGAWLAGLQRIAHLPAALVGGRHDVTTPIDAAWRLHRAWPGSTLTVVPGAHSLGDPAVGRAWADAIAGMGARLGAGDRDGPNGRVQLPDQGGGA